MFDSFNEVVINGDFVVFDGDSDDKFEDTESNWFLFVFSLPETSVVVKIFEDSLGEDVEVGFIIEWLDLEHEEGLGNNNLLCFLWLLSSLGGGSGFFGGGGIFFVVASEKVIEFFLFLNLGGGLAGSSGGGGNWVPCL